MSFIDRWLRPAPHDPGRSVDLVRLVVAVVVATHPLYMLTHRAALATLAAELHARGLPAAATLAWTATLVMLVAAAALLVRRWAAAAALTATVLLVIGAALLYAPRWYVAGGAATPGHPGVELNVLLSVCLSAVAWREWPRPHASPERRARVDAIGLDIIRVGSALLILPHPLHAFVRWDVPGMRAFGESMQQIGFPCGVALVWIEA